MKTADAVVIGGWIMGASAAHFLARKGFGRVVLIERGRLAGVSTGHSAAIVRTYYSNPITLELAKRALHMFEHDRALLGGDCGFRPIGFLLLIGERLRATGEHILESERRHGLHVEDLSPEDIGEFAPQLSLDGVARGILEPRSGYADPTPDRGEPRGRGPPMGLEPRAGVAPRASACGGTASSRLNPSKG
ncbi:NAD(P)/FAD-dependent oxidoreductase [Candidatus Palauibacter sp.]|uniref:NAD(P)/FAD-dependent oxidoreductase n=1 Tax=Candidatus Palauibacter sp. TaxID=3101350 RepID=UPI003AF2A747